MLELLLEWLWDRDFNKYTTKIALLPKLDANDYADGCEDYFWTVCDKDDIKTDKDAKKLFQHIQKMKKMASKIEKLRRKVLVGDD